jgi:hypothetical protein
MPIHHGPRVAHVIWVITVLFITALFMCIKVFNTNYFINYFHDYDGTYNSFLHRVKKFNFF